MRLLREYIRELLKEQPDLGDELFGSDADEDTEYEKDLFSFFVDHFDDTDTSPLSGLDPTLVSNIKAYMADPRYSNVLRPYSGPAFRGMVIDVRELIPIMLTGNLQERPGPDNIQKFLKKKNKQGYSAYDVSYTFEPQAFGTNSLFSHWTKDIGMAYRFAEGDYDEGGSDYRRNVELPMSVVMYAQPGQTFLDAQGLYDLPYQRNAFGGYGMEQEVIGMGDVQISRILIQKVGRW